MASKTTNNAWAVLNSDITAAATSIDLVTGGTARFPTLNTGDYAWGTLSNNANQMEIVKITAIAGNTVQVLRAQDNTTAHAFAAGDRLDLRITAALLNNKMDADVAINYFVAQNSPTINSPSLTGVVTAPTTPGDANDGRVATTAFVAARALATVLPGQAGNAGKFITTDGTTASWAQVYPSMTGNAGKVLSTDGTSTLWIDVAKNGETTQTLTDAATINWDTSLGSVATVKLSGDRIVAAPTNLAVRTYILTVKQDAVGNRKLTWNSNFKWSGGVPPTLSTAANAVDVISLFSDGTYLYGSYLRGVA